MTYICTGNARKKNMLARHALTGVNDDFQGHFTARTGCEFSLVSAVGRCVRGGGGDDNLRISRLAKVDRRGVP